MKIKTTREKRIVLNAKHKFEDRLFYRVYAVDGKGKGIFGADASVVWEEDEKEYAPHFGSCNNSMAFMEIRLAVIKKAYAIARRLNKSK